MSALGGPTALSRQPFFIGINDPVGLNPSGSSAIGGFFYGDATRRR